MKAYIGRYPKGDKERKISIRIDPWDVWNMDHTLALIIVPMLKKTQGRQTRCSSCLRRRCSRRIEKR